MTLYDLGEFKSIDIKIPAPGVTMEMTLRTLDDLTFGEIGLLYYPKTSESLQTSP